MLQLPYTGGVRVRIGPNEKEQPPTRRNLQQSDLFFCNVIIFQVLDTYMYVLAVIKSHHVDK